MVIFPITLFSKSKDKSDLDQELTLQTTNSFSLRHNNEAIQNKFALCMLDYTTEDFTHWKGYIPETTSVSLDKQGHFLGSICNYFPFNRPTTTKMEFK